MADLIVALDVPSSDAALGLVDRVGEAATWYKVGSPLFTRSGPDLLRALHDRGKRIFLDLKFHDIPSAVANAVTSAAEHRVDLLTLHASGGTAMMAAARRAVGADGPRLLGVTVLTSFAAAGVAEVWGRGDVTMPDEVARLAGLAAAAGLHGIVCSPLEAASMKRQHGDDFLVVTPGIRPAGGTSGDQERTATPAAAAQAGADFLVVGRPVRDAPDPRRVVEMIQQEIRTPERV